MTLNPKLQALFREYDECHRHPMNRLTHKVAIPLIVFHIIAMCGWLRLFEVGGQAITFGHVAVVATMAFYVPLNLLYAGLMLVAGVGCLALGQALDARLGVGPARLVVVGVAVFAWIVQLAGHAVWEKRSPAFLRNLLQALVGPIYFIALLLGHWQAPEWQPHAQAAAR
jgi:uncharacterized membrane protein YGL010W